MQHGQEQLNPGAEIVIRTVVEKTNMGASSNWAGGGLRPEAHSPPREAHDAQ
jgi:hypothetical protein